MSTVPVKLEMRVDGQWWVASMADMDCVGQRIELARIRMSLATSHPAIKDRFIRLMTDALNVAIKAIGGDCVVDWDIRKPMKDQT